MGQVNNAFLATSACPRCGCFQLRHFECRCGEIHSDYCDNCGRFSSLKSDEYIELSPINVRCENGPIVHVHDRVKRNR